MTQTMTSPAHTKLGHKANLSPTYWPSNGSYERLISTWTGSSVVALWIDMAHHIMVEESTFSEVPTSLSSNLIFHPLPFTHQKLHTIHLVHLVWALDIYNSVLTLNKARKKSFFDTWHWMKNKKRKEKAAKEDKSLVHI